MNEATAAFRAGELDGAKVMLGKALARAPRIPGAHDLLARIALEQGRPADAITHSQRALSLGGENPMFHNTLVKAASEAGALDAALGEYERLAGQHPASFGAAYGRAMLLLEAGRTDDAIAEFQRSLTLRPDDAAAGLGLVKAYERAYRFADAAEIAKELVAAGAKDVALHISLGRSLFALKNAVGAVSAFRKALELDEHNISALSGLSAALGAGGQVGRAKAVARRLFERVPVYTRQSAKPEADILVVTALRDDYFPQPKQGASVFAPGNAISQVPPRRMNFHQVYLSCPDILEAVRAIGPLDAVYNNVATAEIAAKFGLADRVKALAEALGLPVINPPDAVAKTSRQGNSEWIPASTDLIFPKTVRYAAGMGNLAQIRAAIEAEFSFPVLLRGVYGHHDTDIVLAHDLPGLMVGIQRFAAAQLDFYAIEYCTEEYSPGIFRKIRAAIIGGKFYPTHIGFSPNWNVHRAPEDLDEIAFMKSRPDLMASEESYLRDPVGYIGAENIAKLESVARRVGMDYLGIDYCLRRDGRIIIFEANAAMNAVHANRTGDFPYLAGAADDILDAFETMFLRRAGKL
ncbi:MAG: tetratricopeptide repeat protein [Proteobacteria bacterium]|nr:tetratricopeptide repeat protein [Pseudomonadota bacterium]